MRYIVTADEMREYDKNTIEQIGIPGLVLMERAAMAVASEITKRFTEETVFIVCGVGNNGGDGLALARILMDLHFDVTICVVGDTARASESWKQQRRILEHYSPKIIEEMTLVQGKSYTVVVDALFGVGLSRDITGRYALAIQHMNDLSAYKVAVDIPSGISSDNGRVLGCAFQADVTVTFAFAKLGMYKAKAREYIGRCVLADIGINEKAFLDSGPGYFTYDEMPHMLMPQRTPDGNKGTFGKVLVVAGFEHMIGAGILCARAALEMGSGMVKVICPAENRAILQATLPDVLYGDTDDLQDSLSWADVVVIGPGLGTSNQATRVLEQVLALSMLPIVVDADALNLISKNESLKDALKSYVGEKILTPHMGELSRLTRNEMAYLKENVTDVAKEWSKEYHCNMVCKDARTVVVGWNREMVYLNTSGNSGMATAGSGDVLAGIIAALLAQKEQAFDASCKGVYLHGLTGDEAASVHSEYGVTASRIIENIKALYR